MTYDRTDAREHTRQALARRLADVRAQLGSREALKAEEADLLFQLEGLENDPGAGASRAPVRLPDGSSLSIASPCKESWEAMTGDDRVRHCSRCDKDVYDLSGMTGAEVGAFLSARGETPCVRFFKRHDGTMLTADCPVGRPKKVALRVLAVAGMALGGAAAAAGYVALSPATCPRGGVEEVMGAMPIGPVARRVEPNRAPPPHWGYGDVEPEPPRALMGAPAYHAPE